MSIRLRVGDDVMVVIGKDRSKVGKILRFIKKGRSVRVVVSGVNLCKKAIKPSATKAGGIVSIESSLDISNVAFFDSETGSRSKLGYKIADDGKKVRFLKVTGRILG